MRFAEKAALYARENLPQVPVSTLIDHIEHVAKVAGYDHVCLGSDFDDAPMMPAGLEDASKLPILTAALRDRGWSPPNIRKVLGENILRVLAASEGR
jgi:membrane dipeptidase